ncbi:Sn1-specific diacylglycerol lipase alpha [Acrasis kona]|uniref:sn-1-specific diacylglycerol lipase n=1 Tax=Acrasis kona TaxID=1008807 RepID=A0AAW2ZN27_9EUKA
MLTGEQDEKQPTLKDIFYTAANSMKKAFPSYESLTVADITIGLAAVAVEHKKQNLLQNFYKEPRLFLRDEGDFDHKSYKNAYRHTPPHFNPDGIDPEKFINADKLLNYAYMVYYPIVLESEELEPSKNKEELQQSTIVEGNGKRHYVLMNTQREEKSFLSGESITKKKEHRHLEARPVEDMLEFLVESEHMKQAFFSKLDFELNALVISVRGTQSVLDVLTNFTADPTPLTVHKWYRDEKTHQPCEDRYNQKVEGIVHLGKLNAARWILSRNMSVLEDLFFYGSEQDQTANKYQQKKRKIDRIYCVGHSLGGAVATMLGILLREFFIENRTKLQGRIMPLIHVTSYSPSAFISYNLSRWCRQFVDSFIVGGDLISRFSVGQAEKLRLEIKQSNWKLKAEQYLNEHQWVGSVLDTVNNFLVGRGHNPLISIDKPQNVKNNSTDKEKHHDQSQQPHVGRELNNVITKPDGNMEVQETVTTTSTTDSSTLVRETVSYEIETLYPPGNLYLFIEEEEQGDKRHKRFASMLFNYMEDKLSDDSHQIEELQSPITTTKLIKAWWNSPNPERKEVQLKEDYKRQFVVRHVDAKHFDRIILSPAMIRHHWMYNMYDVFDYVLEDLGEKPTTPVAMASRSQGDSHFSDSHVPQQQQPAPGEPASYRDQITLDVPSSIFNPHLA